MPTYIEAGLIKAGKLLLPFLGSTLLVAITFLLPEQTLNLINATLWAKISAGLFGLCLYLSAWSIYLLRELKKKPNFKPYTHNPEKGYWQHEKTEEKICASCKLEGTLSPLHKYMDGWRCPKHPKTVGYEGNDEKASSNGVRYCS